MAQSRKDSRGYALRTGECQRSDGRYSYSYVDKDRKRQVVYAPDLITLRKKEQQIRRDLEDGLDPRRAERVTVTLPVEVNRAIHSLIDDYNEEEKANARTEGRNALILPRISAHHLRHTFCTRLCETETNVKVIQTIMGHKDIQTTLDIYADCTEEKKKEVIHNIEDKIFIL